LAFRSGLCPGGCGVVQDSFEYLNRVTHGATMNVWIEAVGWSGALLIVAAYGLVSAGKVEARSTLYQLMNIVGAVGFIVNSGWYGALPSVALNVVWLCIGIYTMLRGTSRGRQNVTREEADHGRAD
jgi:hypothetical protein